MKTHTTPIAAAIGSNPAAEKPSFAHISSMLTDDRSKLHHRGLIDVNFAHLLIAMPIPFFSEPPQDIKEWCEAQVSKPGFSLDEAMNSQLETLKAADEDDDAGQELAIYRLDGLMHLMAERGAKGNGVDWIASDRSGELELKWVTADEWDRRHDLVKADLDETFEAVAVNAEESDPREHRRWHIAKDIIALATETDKLVSAQNIADIVEYLDPEYIEQFYSDVMESASVNYPNPADWKLMHKELSHGAWKLFSNMLDNDPAYQAWLGEPAGMLFQELGKGAHTRARIIERNGANPNSSFAVTNLEISGLPAGTVVKVLGNDGNGHVSFHVQRAM